MSGVHILEKLQAANAEGEIWLDSSPLVYAGWVRTFLRAAPAGKRKVWAEQLRRFVNLADIAASVIRGVTTNPPLSYNAIKGNPARWAQEVRRLGEAHPDLDGEGVFWLLYKEIIRRGAERMLPMWTASGHRFGYFCGQADPRVNSDEERMFRQGCELAALGPNVMIKLPGSLSGYRVLERLTALGYATNNTTAFTVPQYVACMEAVQRGLAAARRNGVDLFRWRSVITHMADRLGALGDLKIQAAARGMALSEADVRWAEVAVFKRAYGLGRQRGYPGKMLMCSMRLGPKMRDGTAACWHLEKIAGADVVYTCPPVFIARLMRAEDRLRPFRPDAIHEEIPRAVLDRLRRIPYFERAYEPDGMSAAEFQQQPAYRATTAEFSDAIAEMVGFVQRHLKASERKTSRKQKEVL